MTKQVCWHQPLPFQNVIVHPGGMHIIQSFIGCIAKLMNGSALYVYVAAAYRGMTGTLNGKSWVKAMRSFRVVSAALLKRFLSSGPKTFEETDRVPGCCSSTSYGQALGGQLSPADSPHSPV